MKSSRPLILCLSLLSAVFAAGGLHAATVVYSENFSSSTIFSNGNPYLGGYYTPQLALAQWTGPGEASITTGALTVTSTSQTRSAGIVLAPSVFGGQAGSYTLSFDVTAYSGDTNNSGLVTIWAASGYDLTFSSGNSLVVDTYNAGLQALGSASASSLASSTFTSGGNGKTLTFNYSGSGAVALFLGATTNNYPFPTVTYDNISITRFEAVPEASVSAFAAVVGAGACFVRRRRA